MIRTRPSEIALLVVTALFFLAAPTRGEIGCAGQPVTELDPAKFFDQKQNIDCLRCDECMLTSQACTLACGPTLQLTFPANCYPVVQDGEVCLDALQAASCAAYTSFTADQGATTPTECDFCPPRLDGGP